MIATDCPRFSQKNGHNHAESYPDTAINAPASLRISRKRAPSAFWVRLAELDGLVVTMRYRQPPGGLERCMSGLCPIVPISSYGLMIAAG
jgi:hypothetical protein